MSTVKLSLSIVLQGRTMYSQEEAKALEKSNGSGYDLHKVIVTDKKNKVTEVLNIRTRRSRPATQSINLSQEAYDYMTSNEVPSFAPRICTSKGAKAVENWWKRQPAKDKLILHLNEICSSLGGVSYTYQVFDD